MPLQGFVLNIADLGAIGDGVAVNTGLIQRAIDDCAVLGGGTVRIPAGRFVCGTILLKDGVTLHLDKDAVLLGNADSDDYRAIDSFVDGIGVIRGHCLIGAFDVQHVGIEGEGTIDGQGQAVCRDAAGKGRDIRPFLLRFARSSDVSISGVRLTNAGTWGVHLFQCADVQIDGVHLYNHGMPNNDGIDIDSSRNVTIRDCEVDSGDDAICLKATSMIPCHNIGVTGCTLASNCSPIKFGSESLGDFSNISISHCSIRYADRGAIKLLSVDGAQMTNIRISDIDIQSCPVAIFLRLGARLTTFRPGDTPRPVGALRQIAFTNIRAAMVEKAGVLVSGIPGHAVEEVTFDNLDLTLAGGGTQEDSKLVLEECEGAFPEITMFGDRLPAYGCYLRHARNLTISNLKLTLADEDARSAMVCEDVEGLTGE